eukprot:scaffold27397_cov23-Tisochrysis_lutea.AAC.2
MLDLMLQGGSPHADDLLILRNFILSGGQRQDMYQPLELWEHLHAPGMEVRAYVCDACVFAVCVCDVLAFPLCFSLGIPSNHTGSTQCSAPTFHTGM